MTKNEAIAVLRTCDYVIINEEGVRRTPQSVIDGLTQAPEVKGYFGINTVEDDEGKTYARIGAQFGAFPSSAE